MRVFSLVIIVLSTTLIISCKEHSSEPKLATPIQSTIIPIIPIAVGNQWVYLDSTTTISHNLGVVPWPGIDTTLTVSVDTLRIIDTSTYADQKFYILNRGIIGTSWFPIIYEKFFQRNDSIFSWAENANGVAVDLYLDLITPPQQGSVTFSNMEYEYSASTQNATLNTPVGIFNRYYAYAYTGLPDTMYVVPTVGILRWSAGDFNTITEISSRSIFTLISYTLMKD